MPHGAAVRVHHLADQCFEAGVVAPTQDPAGFGGVSLQQIDLGRAVECGVRFHIAAVIQAGIGNAAPANSRAEWR